MTPAALTPRSLGAALDPSWRIDHPTLDGRWRWHDVYVRRRRSGAALELELREGAASLRLSVAPGAGRPGSVRVAGLSIAWLAPGPEAPAHAACRALARALEGVEVRSWRIPDDAETRPAAAIQAEVETCAAPLVDERDRDVLRADFDNYRALYETTPRACVVRVRQAAVPAVHYPAPARGRVPPSGALYAVPASFHRRDFRAFLGARGYALDGTHLRIVPTPTGFADGMRAALGTPPPFHLRFVRGWRGSMSAMGWVRRVVFQHVWPVTVAPRWAVRTHRVLRRSAAFERIPVDVGMLAHDASLHALGLHALPSAAWNRLTGIARARLRRGSPARHARVAGFFEGTLTRRAWDVWNELAAPDRFLSRFERELPELERELRGL